MWRSTWGVSASGAPLAAPQRLTRPQTATRERRPPRALTKRAAVGRRPGIAGLPPATQKELGELFALLGFAPARLLAARVGPHWSSASPDDVAAFLERWRTSGLSLLRSAYDALHQLVLAAWYGNPRAWPAIGYAGPPKLGP